MGLAEAIVASTTHNGHHGAYADGASPGGVGFSDWIPVEQKTC